MFEAYVYGTCSKGKTYPVLHMMGTCINLLIAEYQSKFPTVVHVRMDIAIDQTHLLEDDDASS